MRLFYLSMLATSAALFAQSTVIIPSTGASGGATDANWSIVSNNLAGETLTGPAPIVTQLGGGWVTPVAGTAWIAPNADQSNATRPGTCCIGYMNYQLKFNVTDPSTAAFQIKVAADSGITMYLNGTDDSNIVFSLDDPNYGSPATVSVKQGVPYNLPDGGPPNVPHFVAGVNTLTVSVGNLTGGPTGLYVNNGIAANTVTSYSSASLADGQSDAAPDPIDAGSGQFYMTETDFRLGGPMKLGFFRYYASQLAKSGFTSALGANWMTNFDIAANVASGKAQVLLFKGLVINFTSTNGGPWQLQSPLKLPYQFVTVSGGGYQFLNPAANLVYSFNATGQLTRIEDRSGNALTVTPGPNGPTKVADGLGRSLTFAYNSANQLANVTDQSGRITLYVHSGTALAGVGDPSMTITSYSYTASGDFLTKEILPLGNVPISQTYDANGRAISQTDATGKTTNIVYNGATTTVTAPSGAVTVHNSDSAGNLLAFTDADGGTTSVTYDPLGRRSTVVDRTGDNFMFTYDPLAGFPNSVQLPDNSATSFTYAPQTQSNFTFDVLSNITYPDGSSTALTRDANGRITNITAPDQSVWAFTYTPSGQVDSSTGPIGDVTSYVWNPDGTLGSITDAVGNTRSYQYDALKRISQFTDANGSTANYAYDSDGRMTSNGLPGQPSWTSHFDSNGRLDSITNPLSAKSTMTYTADNQLATVTNALGSVSTYTWDPEGRLGKFTNGAGESTIYTRDGAGRISSIADNSGTFQSSTYDAQGRLLTSTDGDGLTTTYAYDANGRATTLTTPSGAVWQDSYNWRDEPVTRGNPLGEQYTLGRDVLGRIVSVTDPSQASTSIVRDAYNDATSFTSANGATWNMAYDALGRITSRTDPYSNVTNYTYTGTHLTHIDFPGGGAVDFTYDAAGNRTASTYSDGTAITQTFNALNMSTAASGGVTIARNSSGVPTAVNGIGITVDAAGRPLTYTYAPGNVVTYTYDKSGRVSTIADWLTGTTSVQYTAGSRLSSVTFPNGVQTTYGYDTDGRRNSITYGSLGSIAYTRNDAGRIVSADRNLPVAPTLADGSQQFATQPGGRMTAATYDTMGRVTSQNGRTYTWNLANQLVSYSDPVNSASFTYDGFGAMSSRTISGVTQSFVINHTTRYPSLAILRQDGADLRYFVYLPDGTLLYSIEADTGERHFYHFDEMGNTAFLTGDDGSLIDSYAITPYGEIADHPGTLDNLFTWQGQFGVISEPGDLYYARNRHYDASTARFLSPDLHHSSEPSTSEPYAYARGNPLLYTDPFGTDPLGPQDLQLLRSLIKQLNATDPKNPDLLVFEDEQNLYDFHPDMDGATIYQEAIAEAATARKAAAAKPVTLVVPPALEPSATLASTLSFSAVQQQLASDLTSLISQDGSGLISKELSQLVSDNGGGVVSNDGGSLIGDAGGTVISNDGGSLAARVVSLISQDGSGLLKQVSALISQDGSGLIAQDALKLISQDGSGLISQDGSSLLNLTGNALGNLTSGTSLLSSGSSFGNIYGLEALCVSSPAKNKR